MITWTSRRLCAALAAFGLTGACDGVTGFPGTSAKPPLTNARMAGGTVRLVPPAGYCIDPANLRSAFALMARCDVLGGGNDIEGAPLGIIAISLTLPPAPDTLPTASQIAEVKSVGAPDRIDEAPGRLIFRATGPAPVEGMDMIHWRGAALVGGQVMGIAYFGPTGGRVVSDEGAAILRQLIGRTIAATNAL